MKSNDRSAAKIHLDTVRAKREARKATDAMTLDPLQAEALVLAQREYERVTGLAGQQLHATIRKAWEAKAPWPTSGSVNVAWKDGLPVNLTWSPKAATAAAQPVTAPAQPEVAAE